MGHEQHVDEIEPPEEIQQALPNSVDVERTDEDVQAAEPAHLSRIADEVQHGDGQRHECIKGQVTDQR